MHRWMAALAVLLLAGCANASEASDDGDDGFDDGLQVDEVNGAIRGVVVDARIFPLAGANVTLRSVDPMRSATTDVEGRFIFDLVPAGLHNLRVTKLNHESVDVSVQVVAGDPKPQATKVQLPRLFSQEARMNTQLFQGVIECGWAVSGVGSSLCANDYTRFIPIVGNDPKCPQCEHLLGDNRGHDFAIDAGWQTLILEMTWKPSAQGTSEEMRLILSHTPRPATHWYAATSSADPLLLRVEQGVEHQDRQSDPSLIPPEGMPNAHFFAATSPQDGDRASVALSQTFDVYYSTFYYGKPPEGWSFIAGDEDPFQ